MIKLAIVIVLSIFVTSVFAHQDLGSEAVEARMQSMMKMATNMKALGSMMKGVEPFTANKAKAITEQITKIAGQIPALFKSNETVRKSEASPAIWLNFSDFTSKARDLEAKSAELSKSIVSIGDLKYAMKSIGTSCRSCHRSYKD
ncbi:MAG: cytochrome c [Pseudomonadota bacterium]|nr:cytochrome c [Pseudomonadota bacterium]